MPGFQHTGPNIDYRPQGVWMTGDPKASFEDCCACDTGFCDGVMIEVHFGPHPLIHFCRYHLDLFAGMIVHTRQLKEHGSAAAE